MNDEIWLGYTLVSGGAVWIKRDAVIAFFDDDKATRKGCVLIAGEHTFYIQETLEEVERDLELVEDMG